MSFADRALGQVPARSRVADELFDRALVADTLCDLGAEGAGIKWDAVMFDAIKLSGYTAIQTTLSSGEGPAGRSEGGPWSEGNFGAAMAALNQWQEWFSQHPDKLIHCTKAADIERAKRESKLAVILGFQNAPFKDDVGTVDKLYTAGCRCVQLTYNSRNNLGDGCSERLQTGLSDFGIACVDRMDALGMVVDLSHCGEGTSSDGIAFSRHPAFTHTFCQALHFHPRGKSDSLLRAMADKGGMSGICTVCAETIKSAVGKSS
jgi:membrane dipeptidase